jgi:hypothetical protein
MEAAAIVVANPNGAIQKSIPANYPAKQAWVDEYKAHQ